MYEKQAEAGSKPVLTREFLKKYICFAKSQSKPELNEESIEYAAKLYSLIRSKAKNYD